MKLTKQVLQKAEKHSIIFEGVVSDSPEGLNMTGNGQLLRFIICVGEIGDWCVYVHTADKSKEWIKNHGDKPFSRDNIRNIVEFDDEVWNLYRH